MQAKRFIAAISFAAFFGCCTVWAADVAKSYSGQSQTAPSNAGVGGNYVIGPGDVLDVSVWDNAALARTVVVLPDGNISFPLIGEVRAGGKTVAQLKQEMEQKLSRYVTDMVLSVEVKQCNSMIIYVIGRVNNPGRFAFNSRINVLQALALAGGLNPFAVKDDIKIFRHEGQKTEIFPFRYDEVAGGKHLDENIWLKQGDLILVP
jgi:polysaccharide export outer membrane protein